MPMSYKVQDFVWGIEDLDSSSKFVLLAIASTADNNGVCWPSASFIQKQTGLNIKTVRACLKKLELTGYLIRDRRPGGTDLLTVCMDSPKTGLPEIGDTQNRALYPKTDFGHTRNRVDTLPENGYRISKESVIESVNKEKEKKESARSESRATSFSLSSIPNEWIEVAEKIDSEIDAVKYFEDFADYWRSVPATKGRKRDWLATWRNAIRSIPDWKRKNFLKVNASNLHNTGDNFMDPDYWANEVDEMM